MKTQLLLLSILALSVTSFSAPTTESVASSAALSSFIGGKEGADKGLFHVVERHEFEELASLPGFSFGAPSGLVPGWGVIYGALSGTAAEGDVDGGGGFGMGWGDPYKTVGGSLGIGLGSINIFDTDDGISRGTGNANIGRLFKKAKLGLSAGVSGIDLWHDDSVNKSEESYYFAASKIMPNDIAPVIATIGVGSDSYADISETNKDGKWKEFASIGVYPHPQVSFIADYTGGITTTGISLVPMPRYPITIGLAARDIFKEDKAADTVKFLGSISAAYTF